MLQFSVVNTIPDQRLANVTVALGGGDEELYELAGAIPCAAIPYGAAPGVCYTVLKRLPGVPVSACTFSCELKFNAIEVDPATGVPDAGSDDEGFPEDYPMEDLEVAPSDFMAKVSLGDFKVSSTPTLVLLLLTN